MYRIAASTLALAIATPALAGNKLTDPIIEPEVIAPAPAMYNWTGPYAGVQLGYGSNEVANGFSDPFADPADGTLFGLAAGYNFDFGNWVIGGEIDYNRGNIHNDVRTMNQLVGLKLRAGAKLGAEGRTLLFGTVGLSQFSGEVEGQETMPFLEGPMDSTTQSISATGPALGIGLAHAVSDRIFLTGEVLWHRFSFDYDGGGYYLRSNEMGSSSYDINLTTVTVGANIRF